MRRILLITISLCGLLGCSEDRSIPIETSKINLHLLYEAGSPHINLGTLYYAIDSGTGICYALYDRGISCIPCDSLKRLK